MGLPSSLADVKAQAAEILHWPGNIGIEFRSLQVGAEGQTEAFAIFIPGLADEQLVRTTLIEPLLSFRVNMGRRPALTPLELMRLLPSPRLDTTTDLDGAIKGVMEGDTAVFLPGGDRAVMVKTAAMATADQPKGPITAQHRFESGLLQNLVSIRMRLRDPALMALPVDLMEERAAAAAIIYLNGRASPDLVQKVQDHLRKQAGEGAYRQGFAAGSAGKWGFLPDLMTSVWPDKVAGLLDGGHVAVLVDGVPQAFLAPVTVSALLFSPLDATLARPVSLILRVVRVLMTFLAVTGAATIVALMNYHQEMMPTPLLFSLAAVREQSPLPVALEMTLLEIIQDLIREAAFQWPMRLTPGAVLIAGKLLVLLLTQAGLVGTAPAAFSMAITFMTVGFFGYETLYLLRPWRFLILFGAAVFGFFGMATVLFWFLLYLMTAESFGIPFVGESGLIQTAKYLKASRGKEGNARDGTVGVR